MPWKEAGNVQRYCARNGRNPLALRAQLGLPDDTAVLSPPYGRVFATADGRRTIVATNASAQRLTVQAQVDGRKVTVQVPGREATARTIP